MDYLAFNTTDSLPVITAAAPFKAVLIADKPLTLDQQYFVSDWLIAAGCIYAMVAGTYTDDWEAMLNLVNLGRFDFGQIPDAAVVIATSHPEEALQDVFWFSRYSAMHPCADLTALVCIDLTDSPRAAEITASAAASG
jgi:hypothetical protein